MLDGNGSFLDIVSRVAIEGKVMLIVEKLHAEWQVIILRHLRRLQQPDLIEAIPRQRGNLLTMDRSGGSQHPYIRSNDQTLEVPISSAIWHQTIRQEDDHDSALRFGAVAPSMFVAAVRRSLAGLYSRGRHVFS